MEKESRQEEEVGTSYQEATESVVQACRSRMRKFRACLESKRVRDEQDSKNGYFKCVSRKNEKANQSDGCTAP